MQAFNSFQEMAVGTGALQPQSVMSVFNMGISDAFSEIVEMTNTLDNLCHMDDEFKSDLPPDDPRVDKMYANMVKAIEHLSNASVMLEGLANAKSDSYGDDDDDMW